MLAKYFSRNEVHMTKKELSQLFYLNREIKQLQQKKKLLEADLKKLSTTVGCVQASQMQVPFKLHSVKVEGIGIKDRNKWLSIKAELQDVKNLIELKLEQQVCEYNRLNRYIQSVDDSLIRQILELRFIEGLSWNKVADGVGGNNTEDSVKQACRRYIMKN